MKVLWLAGIYPSEAFPYRGDFIQRHAEAVALFCQVEVLYIVKDEPGGLTNSVREVVNTKDQLTERIIYYKPLKTSIRFIDRFISSLKYKKVSRTAVKKYMEQNGKPAFMHVHIAMKAGLTALWAKRTYKIPYLLTEHWGGYLDEAVPGINDYNFVYRYYWSKIISGAKATTFVSAAFQKQMIKKYAIQHSCVIPNVVNTAVFYPGTRLPGDKIRFIHISTMIYQKNPEGILHALALLKHDFPFEIYVYGPVTTSQMNLVKSLGLQHHVIFRAEVPQQELAETMQQCDALILYSRFETFGCVLIEANACGIPVIVSELEVFHEIVEEGVNGIFAPGEDPAALAEKLKEFVRNKNKFDKNAVAVAAAQKYNYKKIGQQFFELYNRVNAE